MTLKELDKTRDNSISRMDETFKKLKMYDMTLPDKELSSSFSSIGDENDIKAEDPTLLDHFSKFDIDAEVSKFQNNFNFMDSAASTDISNIQSIMIGGNSSRFWLFRKHMISLDYMVLKKDTSNMPKKKRTQLPFYAW